MSGTLHAAYRWPALALAAFLSSACAAQQPATSLPAAQVSTPQSPLSSSQSTQQASDAKPAGPKNIDEARAALRQAEADHPGNSQDVVEAIIDLANIEIEAAQVNE